MSSLDLGGHTAVAAPVSGGRRHRSHKLRLVKKKTVRRMLAKQGLKMRGGGPVEGEVNPMEGGRKRKHHKTHKKSKRHSLFHF